MPQALAVDSRWCDQRMPSGQTGSSYTGPSRRTSGMSFDLHRHAQMLPRSVFGPVKLFVPRRSSCRPPKEPLLPRAAGRSPERVLADTSSTVSELNALLPIHWLGSEPVSLFWLSVLHHVRDTSVSRKTCTADRYQQHLAAASCKD